MGLLRWARPLAAGIASAIAFVASAAGPPLPDLSPDMRLAFPRDHGAHDDVRTEWWYVTGWLRTDDGEEVGFQVTFFRSRTDVEAANPSRFAPRQILFAHAAIADPKVGRLEHDERIARAGFGIAEAATDDANVVLDGWHFARVVAPGTGAPNEAPDAASLHFTTRIAANRFALDLDLASAAPLLAQGADAARPGYSQKGPDPRDASRYYSVPQMRVTGTLARGTAGHRRHVRVTGTAWLDREWSNAYLDPNATGWDWVGLNLDDGGALMAFRMRDRQGRKLWAGGARRLPDGRIERYAPDDVTFTTLRSWSSPRSRTVWPVQQAIDLGANGERPRMRIVVDPMMDDQELDSRASTGTIYWEGAVRVRAGDAQGAQIGKGYLEMTGYDRPIRF